MYIRIAMFIFNLFFLSFFIVSSHGLDLNLGKPYNISWKDCDCDLVSIKLQNNINNNWVTSSLNHLDYLSVITDSEPQYYLWNIPKNLPDNPYRITIVNVDTNLVVDTETFGLNTTTTDTATTPDIIDLKGDEDPPKTANVDTTIRTTIFKEETDSNVNKACFNKISCYPLVAVIIIVALLVLCCICKCCC
uniref:Uncharacterized protein n=1 Tax=viral metagenome TaxID=1070528 RepID=A0A6C0IWU4_9ZZZZ